MGEIDANKSSSVITFTIYVHICIKNLSDFPSFVFTTKYDKYLINAHVLMNEKHTHIMLVPTIIENVSENSLKDIIP